MYSNYSLERLTGKYLYISVLFFACFSCSKPGKPDPAPSLSSDKSINSFIFKAAKNTPHLSVDYVGTIIGDSIKLIVPFVTNLNALVPSIIHSGKFITPGNEAIRDFSAAVNYTVTAEDGSTKTYVVVVNRAALAATLLINSSYANTSNNGSIYAFNAITGQLQWKFTGPSQSLIPTNYFSNGIIYTGIQNKITAFDTITRTIRWEYATGGTVYSCPMVVNGTVFMNSDDMYLYAIDAASGSLKWKFAQGTPIGLGGNYSSPVVINNVVYFGSIDGSVYAVDAVTGQQIWQKTNTISPGTFFQSSPCVVNGILYIGDIAANLIALNTSDGSVLWHYRIGSLVFSSPSVSGNVVFVCSADNSLYAVDAVTGNLKWKYTAAKQIYSSPYVAGGIVYFGTEGTNPNVFYAINESDGTLKWSYTFDESFHSSPVVYGDLVYIGSYRHVLALDKNTGIVKWDYLAAPLEDFRAGPIVVDQLNTIAIPSISGHRQ